jgi:D-sedoheptulose 7-phosphate isomerase
MFPDSQYQSIEKYASDYFQAVSDAYKTIDLSKMTAAQNLLTDCYNSNGRVYTCGNGGSAAISNHLVCDHLKGIRTETSLKPQVVSLSSNIETITAVANDLSYDEVYSYQLASLAQARDILITISSSGQSPNILKAIEWAKGNGVKVIALSGFSGGESRTLADVSIHVDAVNYGVIEDIHQSIMHILAQYIRQAYMSETKVKELKF